MDYEHMKRLYEISEYQAVAINDLMDTFTTKVTQYLVRDHQLGKDVYWMTAKPQCDRALNVLENYYQRRC